MPVIRIDDVNYNALIALQRTKKLPNVNAVLDEILKSVGVA